MSRLLRLLACHRQRIAFAVFVLVCLVTLLAVWVGCVSRALFAVVAVLCGVMAVLDARFSRRLA